MGHKGSAIIREGAVDWEEVHSVQDVLSTIGLDHSDIPVEVCQIKHLAVVAELRQFFRVRVELPQARPGVWELLVPRTRYWMDVKGLSEVKSDLIWFGMIAVLVQDVSTAAAASLVRKILGSLPRRLSEDEAELVAVIIGKSGGNPYTRPVSEQDVQDAYTDASVPITELLDSLTDKGVIKNRRDGMIQLQY